MTPTLAQLSLTFECEINSMFGKETLYPFSRMSPFGKMDLFNIHGMTFAEYPFKRMWLHGAK